MKLETQAVHAGRQVDVGSGAVTEPITMSVTYERAADGEHPSGYFYSSAGNPNRDSLEACVAVLEKGKSAIAFATGSMAITAVLRTLRPGDHVIVPNGVFQGTIRLLRDVMSKWEITYSTVDITDLDMVRSTFRTNTRLLWVEGLSNPLLTIADIRQLAEMAHEHEAIVTVDNTFVTPVFQQPIALGADVVVHSSTKYLGGHGDVLGGVVVVGDKDALDEEIRLLQTREGGVPSPFDCWLIHRGVKTLPYRVRAQADSAMKLALHLVDHPRVEVVHYPGLETHPQHELAQQLFDGFGGIVSIQVEGGEQAAMEVAANVELFTRATSLGQVDSLIQHQASSPTHGPGTDLPDNLLRLSIGLEHPDDLINDLDRALSFH